MKARKTSVVWKIYERLKYVFLLDFAKYLSYLEVQKNSKFDIRKKEVCSKSVIKTFYGSKFLVSEYIFKLVYHYVGSRWSEICCARDISKKSLNTLLHCWIHCYIEYTVAGSCTVEKGVLKIFTQFTGKLQSWSLSLTKLQD